MTDDQRQRVLDAVRTELGDPSTWGTPVEIRGSLALCALNSVHSLRAGTPSVHRVLRRYRDHRTAMGADPEKDSGPDLRAVIDAVGGPSGFSDHVTQNHSKLPGTKRLRADGIYAAREPSGAGHLDDGAAARARRGRRGAARVDPYQGSGHTENPHHQLVPARRVRQSTSVLGLHRPDGGADAHRSAISSRGTPARSCGASARAASPPHQRQREA